jgi:hypothetical protein
VNLGSCRFHKRKENGQQNQHMYRRCNHAAYDGSSYGLHYICAQACLPQNRHEAGEDHAMKFLCQSHRVEMGPGTAIFDPIVKQRVDISPLSC